MLQRRLLALCFVLSAITLGLVLAVRIASGQIGHDYLVWNLELAWVPFIAALALDDVRDASLLLQLPLFGLWIAFFPNSPYLVTDLANYGQRDPAVPPALDLASLIAAGVTGLALAFSSLALIERSIRERFGSRIGLAVSLASLAAASIGIYLGRVLRFNSWDLLTQPRLVARVVRDRVLEPQAHPNASIGMLLLAAFLVACYLRFRRSALEER